LRLTLRLLRSPVWLVARAADLGAVFLQAVALHTGALVAVQGVVACGIVAALVASAVLERRAPSRVEVLGSVTVVVGAILVGRLTTADESGDLPGLLRWAVLAAVVAGVGLLAASWRWSAARTSQA
jgi:hypothetical protein